MKNYFFNFGTQKYFKNCLNVFKLNIFWTKLTVKSLMYALQIRSNTYNASGQVTWDDWDHGHTQDF